MGTAAFGGKLGAQAIGSSFSLTINRGFNRYSLDKAVMNFTVGRINHRIGSFSKNLGSKWMFNSGFGKAFLPSLSIGIQSGLKSASK